MAVVNTAGTIYIDAAGLAASTRTKVSYLIFSSSNNTATVSLRDGVEATSPIKLTLTIHSDSHTVPIDFSRLPLVFNNGIYCTGLVAGDRVSIMTTSTGSNA